MNPPNLYDPAFDPEQPDPVGESPANKAHRLRQLIAHQQATGADALRAAQEHHHTTTNQEKTK